MTVSCKKCTTAFAGLSDMCIMIRPNNAATLTFEKDFVGQVHTTATRNRQADLRDIRCNECRASLGKYITEGRSFYAFAIDQITINGLAYGKGILQQIAEKYSLNRYDWATYFAPKASISAFILLKADAYTAERKQEIGKRLRDFLSERAIDLNDFMISTIADNIIALPHVLVPIFPPHFVAIHCALMPQKRTIKTTEVLLASMEELARLLRDIAEHVFLYLPHQTEIQRRDEVGTVTVDQFSVQDVCLGEFMCHFNSVRLGDSCTLTARDMQGRRRIDNCASDHNASYGTNRLGTPASLQVNTGGSTACSDNANEGRRKVIDCFLISFAPPGTDESIVKRPSSTSSLTVQSDDPGRCFIEVQLNPAADAIYFVPSTATLFLPLRVAPKFFMQYKGAAPLRFVPDPSDYNMHAFVTSRVVGIQFDKATIGLSEICKYFSDITVVTVPFIIVPDSVRGLDHKNRHVTSSVDSNNDSLSTLTTDLGISQLSLRQNDTVRDDFLYDVSVILEARDKIAKNSVVESIRNIIEIKSLDEIKCCLSSYKTKMNENSSQFIQSYWDERFWDCEPSTNLPANFSELGVPDNLVRIRKVILTPTRVIPKREFFAHANRMLRQLVEDTRPHSIVSVSIRDENMDKLHGVGFDEVKRRLEHGFVVCNRRYEFLMASASQMREQECYCIDADVGADVARSKFLDSREYSSVPKYMSRLSLFCSGDLPTIAVDMGRTRLIPDQKAANGDLLTDGSGFICASLADDIRQHIKLPETPAAFQVRISGFKGLLLTVSDDYVANLGSNDGDSSTQIVFHQSMQKCHAPTHNVLGIIDYAKLLPTRFNRESLTLLGTLSDPSRQRPQSCPPWLFRDNVKKLHAEYIDGLSTIFSDKSRSTAELEQLNGMDEPLQGALDMSVDFLHEPFWLSLLRAIYRFRVHDLRTKSFLPIREGCLVYGAPDPFGVLKDGEVYLTTKDKDGERLILGEVLIHRNPCLHPGDIRRCAAVDCIQLRFVKNVLIMPCNQQCQTSLSVACSGGDLDGDRYTVIWDQNLLPPDPSFVCPPVDYNEIASMASQRPEAECIQMNVVDFFIDVIKHDKLGLIARRHLAFSDFAGMGALDPISLELAKMQCLAVDFPKHGYRCIIPSNSNLTTFPDFMEKADKDCYKSVKVIGELYRDCLLLPAVQDIDVNECKLRVSHQEIPTVNCVLESDPFPLDAVGSYNNYKYQMTLLINEFRLSGEADVFVGRPIEWSPEYRSQTRRSTDMLIASRNHIWAIFKRNFEKDLISLSEESKAAKALAWMEAAYSDNTGSPFLSFGWINISYLAKSSTGSTHKHRDLIGKSVCELFKSSTDVTYKIVGNKVRAFHELCNEASAFLTLKNCSLRLYGSASILLCTDRSDLDVCFTHNDGVEPDDIEYLKALSQALPFDRLKTYFHNDFPRFECGFQSADLDYPTRVDVCISQHGLLKTLIIQSLYISDPCIVTLFWYILQWARECGLCRSNVSAMNDYLLNMMVPAEIYAIIIHLLRYKLPDYGKVIEYVDPLCLMQIVMDKIANVTQDEIDRLDILILEFFAMGSKLGTIIGASRELLVDWEFPGIPTVSINCDKIRYFSSQCSLALHNIHVFRNASALLHMTHTVHSDEPIIFKQSYASETAKLLQHSLSFHQERLRNLTKTKVRLSWSDAENCLEVRTIGPISGLYILEQEIQRLGHFSRKREAIDKVVSSHYHMVGSLRIVPVTDCNSRSEAMVVLRRSQIQTNLLNYTRPAWVVAPKIPISITDNAAEKLLLQELINHMYQQLITFPVNDVTFAKNLNIALKFGSFCLQGTGGPNEPHEISVRQLEERLAKGTRLRTSFTPDSVGQAPVTKPRVSNTPFRLNPSFANSLFAEDASDLTSSQMDHMETIYRKLSQNMGFQAAPVGFVRHHSRSKYHITYAAAEHVDLKILYDEDESGGLVRQSVFTRPLFWCNYTVVNHSPECDVIEPNTKLLKTFDTRVQVKTTVDLTDANEHYRRIPDNILVQSCNGVVVNESVRGKVGILRIKDTDYPLYKETCSARLIVGRQWNVRSPQDATKFVEYLVEFDTDQLLNAIRGDNFFSSLSEYCSNQVFPVMYKMQCELHDILRDY